MIRSMESARNTRVYQIGTYLDIQIRLYFLPTFFDMRVYMHMQGRHSNQCHRAMAQVVFLPRPEIRGAFWAVITHNIGSSLLNNFTK